MLAFWRGGYQATTLDDLMLATGMNRASLYATFGDKRQLFLRSLDLYLERFELRATIAADTAVSARDAIRKLLDASVTRLTNPDVPSGCLRINTSLECRGVDVDLERQLHDSNQRFAQAAVDMLQRLKAKGLLAEQESPEALGSFYASVVAGLVVMSQSGADRQALQSVADIAIRAIPGEWEEAGPQPASSL
jgi:AcrR family transcriptional regulator